MKSLFIVILSCLALTSCSSPNKGSLEQAVAAIEAELATAYEVRYKSEWPDRAMQGYHCKFKIVDIQISTSNPDIAQVLVDHWAENDFGQRFHESQSLALYHYNSENIHTWKYINGKWQPVVSGKEHLGGETCIYNTLLRKDVGVKATDSENKASTQKTIQKKEGIHVPLAALIMLEAKFKLPAIAGSFSSDGKKLITADEKGITIWDVESKERINSVNTNSSVLCCGSEVAFSDDWKILTVLPDKYGKEVILVDIETGRIKKEFKDFRDDVKVKSFALSPDGKLLAVGQFSTSVSTLENISIFEIKTGKKVKKIGTGAIFVELLGFSPDGRWLASLSKLTSGDNGYIHIWDTNTWSRSEMDSIPSVSNSPTIAFHPYKSILAFAGDTILLWDFKTGKKLKEISEAGSPAAFADRNTLFYCKKGKEGIAHDLYALDIDSGQQVKTLEKSVGHLLLFSADGTKMANSSGIYNSLGIYLASLRADNATLKLKQERDERLNISGAPKGEFETTAEHEVKIKAIEAEKENIRKEYDALIKEAEGKAGVALNEAINKLYPWSFEISLGKYDADKQVFEVDILGNKTLINVPIEVAKQIEDNKNATVKGMIKWDGSTEAELINANLVIGGIRQFAFGKHIEGN